MQLGAYVSYGELFGLIDETRLIGFAEQLSVEDFLAALGKLVWAFDRDGVDVQRQLAGELPRAARRRLQRQYGNGALAFPARFLRTVRLAVEYADRRPAESLESQSDRELFVKAILGVADVYDDQEELARTDVGEAFISMQLRQSVFQLPHELLAIVRIWRLFVDLPPKLEVHHHEVALANLGERFQRDVGVSLQRYLAICFAIATRFETWDKNPEDWILSPQWVASTNVSMEEFARVVGDLAADLPTLERAFAKATARKQVSLWDVATFARYPLCEVRPELYIPLWPTHLLVRLIGDGFFWRVRSLYNRDDEPATVGAAMGRLLEAHLREAAESAYALSGRSDRLFGEVSFSGGLGPDLAIVEDAGLVLVEIGLDRAHFEKTILEGRIDSLRSDIETILIKRAAQIDRKIAAIRDGRLRYEQGVDLSAMTIRPIVVLLEGFPRGPLIDDMIARAIAKAGHIQGIGVQPLIVLSAEEFEAALALVEHRGDSLRTLLDAWAGDSSPDRDLRVFVEHRLGQRPVPSCIEGWWQQLKNELVSELGGPVQLDGGDPNYLRKWQALTPGDSRERVGAVGGEQKAQNLMQAYPRAGPGTQPSFEAH